MCIFVSYLPVITTDFGKKVKPLIESESNTLTPSNGIFDGRNGLEPVAINILSDVISLLGASLLLSSEIINSCDDDNDDESLVLLNFAYPSIKVTPAYSNCLLISFALNFHH